MLINNDFDTNSSFHHVESYMTTKYGPTTQKADKDIDLLLKYAVGGFQAKVFENMSYKDSLGKLHLFECILTGKKPNSAVYLKLHLLHREANLELFSHLETLSLTDEYIHDLANFRSKLERNLFNTFTASKESNILLWKHFYKIASEGHQRTTPDPQRVRDIRNQLDKLHNNKLQRLLKQFSMFTYKVQLKALEALRKNPRVKRRLGSYSKSWVANTDIHLSQISSDKTKRETIDNLIMETEKRNKRMLITQGRDLMSQYGLRSNPVVEEPKSTKHQRKLFN